MTPMSKQKKKVIYKPDDGRTLFPVVGPDGRPIAETETKKTRASKKERRAMIKAAYIAMLPVLICIAVGFTAVSLLLYFLLK